MAQVENPTGRIKTLKAQIVRLKEKERQQAILLWFSFLFLVLGAVITLLNYLGEMPKNLHMSPGECILAVLTIAGFIYDHDYSPKPHQRLEENVHVYKERKKAQPKKK